MPSPAIAVAIFDLAENPPRLSRRGPGTVVYGEAQVLVRLHGKSLGIIRTPFVDDHLEPSTIHDLALAKFDDVIRDHLREDGLDEHDVALADPAQWLTFPCWATATDLPKVTVAIPTYDRIEELERCLVTLLAMDYPDFEVLVVKNGGAEADIGSVIARLAADDSRLRLLTTHNAGAALARNVALHAAQGSIIAYTDDDVIVDRFWIRALVQRMMSDDAIACVTGYVMAAQLESDAQTWFEQYLGFGRGFIKREYDLETTGDDIAVMYPYSIGNVGSGNNAAYRVDALRNSGGWDVSLGPGTPAYAGEDLDTFIKVVMAGRKIAYEPSALISHFHRFDYDGLETQMTQYGVGIAAIMTKWMPRSPRVSARVLKRLPAGIRVVRAKASASNVEGSAPTFPKRLSQRHNRGIVVGPLLYVQSVLRTRRNRALRRDDHGVVIEVLDS